MRILPVLIVTLLSSSLFLAKAIAQNQIDQEIAEGKADAVEAIKYDCAGISFYGLTKKISAQVDIAGRDGSPSFHCLRQVEQGFASTLDLTLDKCRQDLSVTETSARDVIYKNLSLQLDQDIRTCLSQPAPMPIQE